MAQATAIRISKRNREIIERNTDFMENDNITDRLTFVLNDYERIKQYLKKDKPPGFFSGFF
jgi:uncharacterized protein YllA (UPF0747 family)